MKIRVAEVTQPSMRHKNPSVRHEPMNCSIFEAPLLGGTVHSNGMVFPWKAKAKWVNVNSMAPHTCQHFDRHDPQEFCGWTSSG